MQNRFTFKDFVVIGLLIVAVLLVLGAIRQSDRTFEKLQDLSRRVSELDGRLQDLTKVAASGEGSFVPLRRSSRGGDRASRSRAG